MGRQKSGIVEESAQRDAGVERRPDFANSTARSRCVGDTFGSRRFCEISPSNLCAKSRTCSWTAFQLCPICRQHGCCCLIARRHANFVLRTVRPELAMDYAVSHDLAIWRCMTQILGIHAENVPELSHQTASLPLSMGGLRLRRPTELRMINQRHPVVAGEILTALSGSEAPSIRAVLECEAILREADFEMPTWAELADGARRNQPENPEDEHEPADPTHGWQRDATLKLQTSSSFQEEFWPLFSELEKAQMRSQSRPMSSDPSPVFQLHGKRVLTPSPFRFLLLRRAPSPPSSHRASLSMWPSVNLTPWATIVQRVRLWVSWGGEVSLWSLPRRG